MKKDIEIKGARVHNLKNIDVKIPRNKLVVLTGLSGSGKSSLAFHTLYAEGQRRYVESLSSYARQFLGKFDKPDVDSITGISPAIAIEQKVIGRSSRSTVGTSTEIYDYIKLLFARVGRTISPYTNQEVIRYKTADVVDVIHHLPEDSRFAILSPLAFKSDNEFVLKQESFIQQGFTRYFSNGEWLEIDGCTYQKNNAYYLLIDRMIRNDEMELSRLTDSIDLAFAQGEGRCAVYESEGDVIKLYSSFFEENGIQFDEPSLHLFSFNNPVGACKTCEGFGSIIGIDPNLVIPNQNLSIYQDCVACWKGEKMSEWKDDVIRGAKAANLPIHTPYNDLSESQKKTLWNGTSHFHGIHAFFKYLEGETYKIQYRVMLSRYRGRTPCTDCFGTRLRKEANYVKINGKSISELLLLPLDQCLHFFEHVELDVHEQAVAKRILVEITSRLQFLCNVGLEYLTLNRLSNTLSGGESQRIHLATSIGSALVGSMYILDEPSIGLHPRDTERLIQVLRALRDQGNTVIVVEHEEEIIKHADHVIDIGPEAGAFGGEVVFSGEISKLLKQKNSLTADYLTGRKTIFIDRKTTKFKDFIRLTGARKHNLQNVDIEIPLHAFTAVSGVSGSGKSTLIKSVLYPALSQHIQGIASAQQDFTDLTGDLKSIVNLEFIDQNPIGKSSRSNPVTYLKAYDDIRAIFTTVPLAKQMQLKPSHFSFNVSGGRCDACEGDGYQTIEMQFMADVELLCEECKGKRFKEEILEVEYKGKNISDILNMTVAEAIPFFSNEHSVSSKHLIQKLTALAEVGLDYVRLGQSNSTLSGGEAQRIKLASFLVKGPNQPHTLFIFDEPTTGLHFHDVQKLMNTFNALLKQGHTIIAIEHHTDVIRNADWVIDLGPEGGDKGGKLLFCGPKEKFSSADTFTSRSVFK